MSRRPVPVAENRTKWAEAIAASKRGETDPPPTRPTAVEVVDDPFRPGHTVRKSLADVHPAERLAYAVAAGFDEMKEK